MRYFIDTEFIANGANQPIHLLSLGVAAEDNRTFYAVNEIAPVRIANEWVRQHVFPRLRQPLPVVRSLSWPQTVECYGRPDAIAAALFAFIDPDPEFWADYGAFDYVVVSQLMGGMEAWPHGWPMYFNDLQQLAASIPGLHHESSSIHHALLDALQLRDDWHVCHKWAMEARAF